MPALTAIAAGAGDARSQTSRDAIAHRDGHTEAAAARRAIEITGVSPASDLNTELRLETTEEEEAAPKGDAPIKEGSLVHFDTGAAMNHYSADTQRTVPSGDRSTDEQ